ncbi:MAG: asparagine synthase (glutamine-hydrolyzing) [Acidimicrobiales bacterium]|nr:asparagine synthase (glutamine-hydrolyzing) [Acidimicrobiales bacterium]
MCGIAGAVGDAARDPEARARVDAMVTAIDHRGPDARGVVTLDGPQGREAVLGAVRLRVIDLDPAADQPFSDTEGHVWTVFNGEIYNFPEIRALLENAGFRFRSSSDTECLVHLYRYLDGDVAAMATRLRGMFAFGVFDATTGRFVAARDRLGIKPFVWTPTRGGLAFCSEQRALAHARYVDGSPNVDALAGYLTKGVASNGQSILEGVRHLGPGAALTWENGTTTESTWWEPRVTTRTTLFLPELGQKELDDVAPDAVRRHLVADRSVGVFLSSGTDSQSVAALAARHGSIRSLTVSFPDDPDLDESTAAREAAQRLGLTHSEVPVTAADALAALPTALASYDSPTSDGFNSWLIARAAKEAGLVVVLSGLGGDELFAGYRTFQTVPPLRQALRVIDRLPRQARSALAAVGGRSAITRPWVRALDGGAGISDAYHLTRRLFSQSELGAIGLGTPTLPVVNDFCDPIDAVTLLEIGSYLRDQLLPDSDTTSMSHSVELRVPLLDDEIVAVSLALPADVRKQGKQLLATTAGLGLHPPKRPFALPMQKWVGSSLRATMREALLDDALPFGDVLPPAFRQQLWRDTEANNVQWAKPWSVAALRLWPQANGFDW